MDWSSATMGLLAGCALMAAWLVWWALPAVRLLEGVAARLERGESVRSQAVRGGPSRMRHLAESLSRAAMLSQTATEHYRFVLADVAHQQRTQLQLLALRLQRLPDEPFTDGRSVRALAMTDMKRLDGTMTELLEAARIVKPMSPVRVGVATAVRVRVAAWRDAVALQHIVLLPILAEDPPVMVRAGTLDQVLDILLDNAIKNSPSRGYVLVTVTRSDGRAVVEVTDEGPGMTEEECARATERGWRGGTATDGSGLGLSIATVLVRSQGGRLSFLGNRDGRGLTVRLEFPDCDSG